MNAIFGTRNWAIWADAKGKRHGGVVQSIDGAWAKVLRDFDHKIVRVAVSRMKAV